MGNEESGSHGPSWWDVESLIAELESSYMVRIDISMSCVTRNHTHRAYWDIIVAAVPWGQLKGAKRHQRRVNFRGNGGARTAPAAFYGALMLLSMDLEGDPTEAERSAAGL